MVYVLRHCSFSASARAESWPAVFSTKGLIKDWVQKDQAAKERDGAIDTWYYILIFNKYQRDGTEGREIGLEAENDRKATQNRNIARCAVQSDQYNFNEAATEAQIARATVLIVTSLPAATRAAQQPS